MLLEISTLTKKNEENDLPPAAEKKIEEEKFP
jgi:hypothetical protein